MNAQEVYYGSNGELTKAFYARLQQCGPIGEVAVELFRAQKASARAKVYRGGIPVIASYKTLSYDKKAWSLRQLVNVLMNHYQKLRIPWGWKKDPREKFASYVLYVDLPQGQVSFHDPERMTGPEYLSDWDGKHLSAERIIAFCDYVLINHFPTPSLFPEHAKLNI